MQPSRSSALVILLAVLAFLCTWFALGFLQGGSRVEFVAAYLGFLAIGSFGGAALFPRYRDSLFLGALGGLLGPAVALAIITGNQTGTLNPGGAVFKGMARTMAILWYPGNWVSSLLGMEARMSDLHLSSRAELVEWLRLVPLNTFVYALVAGGVQLLFGARSHPETRE